MKLNFDFLVSTNGTLPSKNWKKLGPVTSLGDGQYRFTDGGATGQPKRFYLLREQYHAVSPAPAGRNIYSHGITKPEAHRSDMELKMPPRWGFSSFGVGGYNDVAAPELKYGSSAAVLTAALIQGQWGLGDEGCLLYTSPSPRDS